MTLTSERIPAQGPAVVYHRHGGPEVLEVVEMPVPEPADGEVLLRHTAVGVNFSDVNARRGGFYTQAADPWPAIPGNEAAGVIVAAGEGADGFGPGDRVGYAGMGGAFFSKSGAYAAYRAVPAARLIRLPDGVDDVTAAALLLKGLTASGVINRFHRPAAGETVLVHAAASGVGLLLCQWASHLGARVIGTVGSAEKAEIAGRNGCDVPVLYRETDFVAAVRAECPEGVSAVFDGVGKDTLLPSLDCLAPFGKLVNYGNASGPAPAVDPMLLSAKGSLSLARLAVGDHVRAPADYLGYSAEVLDLCGRGVLRPHLGAVLPLAEAAEAHRMIEAGLGPGAIVLVP